AAGTAKLIYLVYSFSNLSYQIYKLYNLDRFTIVPFFLTSLLKNKDNLVDVGMIQSRGRLRFMNKTAFFSSLPTAKGVRNFKATVRLSLVSSAFHPVR
ncbi:MAG: hypothetical protein ACE5IW_10050, partial [bacterium]